MFRTIKHGINLIRHSLRDVGLSAKRSSKWPTVEKHFLEAHPICAACGGKKRLNVHHCMPFHLDPNLELDPNNLITLCMGKLECHLHIGHSGNFKLYNPNVRKNASEALANPEKFEDIVQQAILDSKSN
jgi:5-methylcytosine-specific restriction enzyme A